MEPKYKTRKDDHDYMTPDHVATFLRDHNTGTDNLGRHALSEIVRSHSIPDHTPTVLDAACGTCVNFEVFKNRRVPCHYVGLDRTQQLLDHAGNLYVPATSGDITNLVGLRQGYVQEMPFEDNSFDIVILRHIVEHLEEGYELALKEAWRVAKKEVVVIFFENPTSASDHVFCESEPDDNGCTYWWNKYSWMKFSKFIVDDLGAFFTRNVIVTPGAAAQDTIIRIYK